MVKDNFLLLLDYKNITFKFFPYFSLHPNMYPIAPLRYASGTEPQVNGQIEKFFVFWRTSRSWIIFSGVTKPFFVVISKKNSLRPV